MKKFLGILVLGLLLNGCATATYQDPDRYSAGITKVMKEHALRNMDYHAVIHAASSVTAPMIYSHNSFDKVEHYGMTDCRKKYADCFLYELRYLGHDPKVGYIYKETEKKKNQIIEKQNKEEEKKEEEQLAKEKKEKEEEKIEEKKADDDVF